MNFNFEEDVILENDRVRLAPLNAVAREGLLHIALGNPALLQYSPKTINSPSEFNLYFDDAILARKSQNRYAFSIFDKVANVYVGSTSFGGISDENSRIEIGWTWLGKDFQRSGLNRNCKFLLMEYVFEHLEFERLELKTDVRNSQSRQAIEGIGGKLEGILRSHTLMSDGHRRDTVYYSILKNEWSALKSAFRK
jgi:N-acetyltransferase